MEGDQARIIGSIVNFLNADSSSNLGSRETIGAAIIPATAPIAAANPQPKAGHPADTNSRPVRLDTRILRCRPHRQSQRVKRKKGRPGTTNDQTHPLCRSDHNRASTTRLRLRAATCDAIRRLPERRMRKISCTTKGGETKRWLVEQQELRPQHGVAHTVPAAVISILRWSARFSTFTSSAEATPYCSII